MKSLKKMFSARMFKAGTYSAFASILVVAIAVAVNLVVSALPSAATQLDMTQNNLYSLSEQTKQIVSAVDQPVTLSLITTIGSEDQQLQTLLDRYKGLSSNVTVKVIDPTEQPGFAKQYGIETLYRNSVLVECGERYRYIGNDEIYVQDYSMNYSTYSYDTTTTFNGEQKLTSAISYVTSASLPKVYLLTGHGESELSESFKTAIENENMTCEDLKLLSLDAVPEDANCIVINAPTSDLSEAEATMLVNYVQNGGNVALLTSYIAKDEMPNLRLLGTAMGVELVDGLVVEGDSSYCLRGYPAYVAADLNSHTITDPLINSRMYVLTPLAQGLKQTDGATGTVTALLTTSDKAYAKLAGMSSTTTEKEEGDTDGPFNLAMAVEQGSGHFVWVSSSMLLSDEINAYVSGGNEDFFLNSLGWMCAREDTISIRAKSLDTTGLTITSAQSGTWSTILIGVIPAALIAIGLVIWFRRKRK